MDVQIIKDRQLGFSNAQWIGASHDATRAGHRPGSHEWWDHIRDTLGISRNFCQSKEK